MNQHEFTPHALDKNKCKHCKRTYVDAHSPLSTCESCAKRIRVTLFGDADNPKAMLLCESCTTAEIKANVEAHKQDVLEHGQERVDAMLALARENDAAVRYNGDFFNAKVLALETIRTEINSSDSTADEKAFKFQNYLAERISHLKQVVFDLDEKKHQAIVEEQVIRKSLREMERELRAEIRAKIKETDSQYPIQQAKTIKPKVKKESLGTFDRLVQAFMLFHECTKEQAIEAIRKGSGGKLSGIPK